MVDQEFAWVARNRTLVVHRVNKKTLRAHCGKQLADFEFIAENWDPGHKRTCRRCATVYTFEGTGLKPVDKSGENERQRGENL